MTATAVEPVVETSTDDEPDIGHISCHCSDNETGWCGIDLSDIPVDDDPFDMDADDACVLCKIVIERLDDRQCPWGCTCSDECGPEEQMRGYSSSHSVLDEWASSKYHK